MSKGSSKIKRLGIKSIHYSDNKVIIEDSFSKNVEILYDVEYDDIENLNKAININKNNDERYVDLVDLDDKSGFVLSGNVNSKKVKTEVNNVKNISYLHKKTNLSLNDNFNIQIYNNLMDINKIIISYCNHVLYSINDLSKGEGMVSSKNIW